MAHSKLFLFGRRIVRHVQQPGRPVETAGGYVARFLEADDIDVSRPPTTTEWARLVWRGWLRWLFWGALAGAAGAYIVSHLVGGVS